MTLKDIAELAGTSVSTVSRSLNNSPLISEETRARVRAIAAIHGFEPNAIARGLATRTVGTIGVILPENYDRFDGLLYNAALHNDLRSSLERAELDTIVAFKRNRFSGRDNIEKLVMRKKIDGLILVQPELDRRSVKFLEQKQIPYVLIQYPPDEQKLPYDLFFADSWTGGRLVAQHLISRGCRSPLCISGGKERQSLQRIAGFRDGYTAAGFDPDTMIVLDGDYSAPSASTLIRENLPLITKSDAIFAANDLMAFGAMEALRSAGLRIPDEMAVVGYDDTPLATALIPQLTSVHQPEEEIAFLACERLLKLIKEHNDYGRRVSPPQTTALQPRLIVRQSCGSVTSSIPPVTRP
ncbi:MAG: LacI family transcriptional regulator [Spirochaetaceae bacterium]|nr:MAG: LacI family transcriptional regulator [Spirochaetaceae bacterium]